MPRWFVILVALGACKGEPPAGVSGWSARSKTSVKFTVRLEKPLADSQGITLKAACQVGADRLVDVAQSTSPLQPGKAVELDLSLFSDPLPATPSSCEYEVSERGLTSSHVIAMRCDDKDGACPPNVISRAGAGPTNVSAGLSNVIPKDKHLQLRYRATAHKDMPRGAHLVRMTSCKGHRNDDSWHELGFLKAGESIARSALTEKLGLPPPGTPCETVLGYSPERLGEITDLATFCHRDAIITPGPCPR